MMLVLYESFVQGTTITFIQMFNPIYGLFMSVITFSAYVGHLFKAEYEYVYFDDFRFTLTNELGMPDNGAQARFHNSIKEAVL